MYSACLHLYEDYSNDIISTSIEIMNIQYTVCVMPV